MKPVLISILACVFCLVGQTETRSQEVQIAPRVEIGIMDYQLDDSSESLRVDGNDEDFALNNMNINDIHYIADLGLEGRYGKFLADIKFRTNIDDIEERDEGKINTGIINP